MMTVEQFWDKFWTRAKIKECMENGWLVNNTMPLRFAEAYGEHVRTTLGNMTDAEEAWALAILEDRRTLGRRVLAVTLKHDSVDTTIREVGEMSYNTPVKCLGDMFIREDDLTKDMFGQ